jgi:hypothetical protein
MTRLHWPFQSGYLVSSAARALPAVPVKAAASAMAAAAVALALRMLIPLIGDEDRS